MSERAQAAADQSREAFDRRSCRARGSGARRLLLDAARGVFLSDFLDSSGECRVTFWVHDLGFHDLGLHTFGLHALRLDGSRAAPDDSDVE